MASETNSSTIPAATSIFAEPSPLPFHAPQFDRIKDTDYQPAIEEGIAIKLAEIAVIADNPEPPTFENTVVALERTGEVYDRASMAFSQMVGANTNDVLDAADSALSPQIAAMNDAIYLDTRLFARVKAVYEQREALGLEGEDLMLLETTYADFVHGGAELDEAAKDELRQINSRLSKLQTGFSQTVTHASVAGAITVDTREELSGLSEGEIAAAAAVAKERGLEGKYVLTLGNTTQQALLAKLDNRDVRERLFMASIERNLHDDKDNTSETVREIARLRARKAALFNKPDFAAWQMYDRMVDRPSGAVDFMKQMVPALSATQQREADLLNERIRKDGHNFSVQPWDWPYYAEKVRQEQFALDESRIKQYFPVDQVLVDGAFHAANLLYGLTFEKRDDIPVYADGVSVYTVFDKDGSELALFFFDPLQRDSKRGGAWMNSFVKQTRLLGTKPVICNTLNVAPPAKGEPVLLSSDDVRTLFHEFGHGLHGIFASQKYASLSGTSTARDWVEFPSQFNENFAYVPAIRKNYAKHWQTGEPLPDELAAAMDKAHTFNQGYKLGEVVTAALLDMDWHMIGEGEAPRDDLAFENSALEKTGLHTDLVPPRYRSTYFRHIFASSGYAAGYYSYLWAEMLHHDAYTYVESEGGISREMGERIRETFLGQGHSKPYEQMFRDFTGRDPQVEPMLKARGLVATE